MSPSKLVTGSITVPKWFASLVSSALIAILIYVYPWVVSVSTQLKVLEEQNKNIASIAVELKEHIKDPSIHSTAIGVLYERLANIERRIDELKDKVN